MLLRKGGGFGDSKSKQSSSHFVLLRQLRNKLFRILYDDVTIYD